MSETPHGICQLQVHCTIKRWKKVVQCLKSEALPSQASGKGLNDARIKKVCHQCSLRIQRFPPPLPMRYQRPVPPLRCRPL